MSYKSSQLDKSKTDFWQLHPQLILKPSNTWGNNIPESLSTLARHKLGTRRLLIAVIGQDVNAAPVSRKRDHMLWACTGSTPCSSDSCKMSTEVALWKLSHGNMDADEQADGGQLARPLNVLLVCELSELLLSACTSVAGMRNARSRPAVLACSRNGRNNFLLTAWYIQQFTEFTYNSQLQWSETFHNRVECMREMITATLAHCVQTYKSEQILTAASANS